MANAQAEAEKKKVVNFVHCLYCEWILRIGSYQKKKKNLELELYQLNPLNSVLLQNPVVAVVDDKVAVNRKRGTKKLAEAQKKAIDKPEPEIIVVISSEEEKVKSVSGRKSRERSSRKEIKTLTAILTARSKVIGRLLLPHVLRYFYSFFVFQCVYWIRLPPGCLWSHK